ncbi:carboxypeptidase Y [Plectosphaerella cucumerina]|uniref:Carboxypeptidase Y n=1 Tax=Plectosphaerella cucumerina TaxID=40658 RepID=A0A8K0TQF4_9PEZI|nr:carboxypeptidase Y [Plectosphaerella cucumerina]
MILASSIAYGSLLVAVGQAAPGQQQQPLLLDEPDFNLREQTDILCDAGSRHWTGSVPISDDKNMSFWFFESRNSPKTDPVLLWMSGGPGASGEFGIFKDSGPCQVNSDGNSTSKREFSWTDEANVLFIDQPVGVGFSSITDRDLMAVTLEQGGSDLYAFLSLFTTQIFPETKKLPWHITGESMGGHYVTGYAKYLVQQQRERSAHHQPGTLAIDIATAIIVAGYIDATRSTAGLYDYLCLDWRKDGHEPLVRHAAACASMAAGVPSCEAKAALCRATYDKEVCILAANHCNATVAGYFWEHVKPGGWNPYDHRATCDEPPLCSDMQGGPTHKYLNQPWVLDRLGYPGKSLSLIDMDANQRWQRDGHLFLPATRELQWLLDETDIRVLFINGNEDMTINSPGQIRMLDEQPWKRQAWFRAQTFSGWYFEGGDLAPESSRAAQGGTQKGDDRLSLYLVDDAGHMAPWDQPEAVGAIVRAWIRG